MTTKRILNINDFFDGVSISFLSYYFIKMNYKQIKLNFINIDYNLIQSNKSIIKLNLEFLETLKIS